jgi:hypothetical protein
MELYVHSPIRPVGVQLQLSMNIKAKTCICFTCFLCILHVIVKLGDLNANGRIILKMNNREVGSWSLGYACVQRPVFMNTAVK